MDIRKDSAIFKRLKEEIRQSFRYSYINGNDEYKNAYKKIIMGILEGADSIKLPLKDLTFYGDVYRTCISENPLLYYIEKVWFTINPLEVTVHFSYSDDWSECVTVYNKIFAIIEKVRKQCLGCNDIQKEKIIHEYIIKNVTYYKDDTLPVHSGHAFFVYGKAVCDGISKAAKILMDSVGLKSVVVNGSSENSNGFIDGENSGHAWNVLWVMGKPYHVDFTFDANLTSKKDIIRYDYYNLSDDQIRKDHTYDDIGISSNHENDWFRENSLYFTKKSELRNYIRNQLNKKAMYAGFKLPFTIDQKKTIDDIIQMIKNDINNIVNCNMSYNISVNEKQMVIYLYFLW